MRKLLIIFLMFGILTTVKAQEKRMEIEGTVTYLTSQNVYVKFLSAKEIKPGDEIYIRKDSILVPVISVENCSSVSCVGKAIGELKLKLGDKVIALVPKEKESKVQETRKAEQTNTTQESTGSGVRDSVNSTPKRKQEIKGRLLFSSYSNFSSTSGGNNHRLRYTFSMDITNISESRFSFESYVSFSHKLNDWSPIRQDIFNGLKIYNLNLKYDLGKNTTVWMGRKINPNTSSLGAIDGLLVESNYKHFYWGAVAGFRPDYTDYGFNAHLLEYGGYFGHILQNTNGRMQTSVGVFEQTNSGKTDRRFAYFQHDNSLIKNVNVFFSSELDLFKLVKNPLAGDSIASYHSASDLILTSVYLSVNYRPFKKLSLSGSYDNRRNVIYYETFKNYVDKMLEDASRQGFQFRINYRPITFMNVGVSTSYRDRSKDLHPTKNTNGFLSYSQIPGIKVSASLSANLIQTSYINGAIYSIRFDKDFMEGKLNAGINYQYVNFLYQNSTGSLKQHIGEVELSYQVSRNFSFSVNYEGTFEKQTNYHSIYLSIIKRF
jgi:hypothetical protein